MTTTLLQPFSDINDLTDVEKCHFSRVALLNTYNNNYGEVHTALKKEKEKKKKKISVFYFFPSFLLPEIVADVGVGVRSAFFIDVIQSISDS